jgi:hypothetical protein
MSLILDGSNGITFPNSSTQAVGFYGFKNRIINGAMVIDQRNAGASVGSGASTFWAVDRYQVNESVASKLTAQQTPSATETGYATRVAAGFSNYLAFTSASAYSIGSGDYFFFRQRIEGTNSSDLAWGTSAAKTVTLSFWVNASLTGTYSVMITNSGQVRTYIASYTVNAANTWEQKTITIPGDQSGTWLTTTGIGVDVNFCLGSGSTYTTSTLNTWATAFYLAATGQVNVTGTNGATFYITGVQLEAGSTATSFDYRPYGTELSLCQRYLPAWNNAGAGSVNGALGSCYYYSTTNAGWVLTLPVTARVPPTGISFSAVGDFQVDAVSSNRVTGLVISSTSQYVLGLISTDAGSNTAGWGGRPRWQNTSTGQLLATGCEL